MGRMKMTARVTLTMVLVVVAAAVLAGEPPPPPPLVAADGTKAVTFPTRTIPEPEARGKRYPVPITADCKNPVIWGWTCELPDGSGLAFGGSHKTADDGIAHTQIKEGGAWKPITEELRKNNPLQPRHDQVWALRETCKDTLARARRLFFDGKSGEEEAKLLAADVDPAVQKLIADLAKLAGELKSSAGLAEYEAGQVKHALARLETAAGQLKPFGPRTTPQQLAAMRKAQIELEVAAEAFDCEPPPRALSKTSYEPKTKLFVIFGGEHFDYNMNDLWVFDPAKRRWFQRNQEAAPEPRADHHLEALGDGRIAMRGGYCHIANQAEWAIYTHAGPARWIYDVEKNAWSADGHQEKPCPSGSRALNYWPPAAPEAFMGGARPDAAANEAKLKALPVNTWVKLPTAIPLGGRDWGTWGVDFERDMFYVWAGGHCSYGGNDVARYHLATDRWELTEVPSLPLGGIGSNFDYPWGVDFNRRPWVKCHTWNSHAHDPVLGKMVQMGWPAPWDANFYLYDPDRADWAPRRALGAAAGSASVMGSNLRHTKHGMINWCGGGVWLLDEKSMEWKSVKLDGKMPGSCVDSCTLVYDPKRDRMLFFSTGYYQPYDGQVYALDFATSKVAALSPEGMDTAKSWTRELREIGYHPDSDLFLIPEQFKKNNTIYPGQFLAYDAAKNRWVLVKLAVGPGVNFNILSGFIAYDAKRGLFWSGSTHSGGGVYVLRFDPAKAETTPVKDFAPSPVQPAGEKK
jgi:hypothetical protein